MKIKGRLGSGKCNVCRDVVPYSELNKETRTGKGSKTLICDHCWNRRIDLGLIKGEYVGT